jgi:hypothetical protein
MNFESIGGRRYLLAWAAGVAATALQWAGKLDVSGVAYAAIIMGTVAAYITGNVVQKRSEAGK